MIIKDYKIEHIIKQTPTCRKYKASKNQKLFFIEEYLTIDNFNETMYKQRKKMAICDHLVQLIQDFHLNDKEYYVSEYIETDLQQILDQKKSGLMELSDALEYFSNLIEAIEQFHKEKVFWRDYSLNKIKVKNGNLYFYDLSQIQILKRQKKLFADNYNNPFMPPQYYLEDGYGQSASIWAAGVFLFYLLTRTYPFCNYEKNIPKLLQEMKAKCHGEFNLTAVLQKMQIKNESIKNKYSLNQLFKGIFVFDSTFRKTFYDLKQHPLIKIYFHKKNQIEKIMQSPDSQTLASIFHPKIKKQKKQIWALALHKQQIVLDFIQNCSQSMLKDNPDVFSQQLRYKTQITILKIALINCKKLLDVFYGRKRPFFEIKQEEWEQLKGGQTIKWAKQKFQKKLQVFSSFLKSACNHISGEDKFFNQQIPEEFQAIKKDYRKQLSQMYRIGKLQLVKNKANPQMKRRLTENLVRIVILFLVNKVFEEDNKKEDFKYYFEWSKEWIQKETQLKLRDFIKTVTAKHLQSE